MCNCERMAIAGSNREKSLNQNRACSPHFNFFHFLVYFNLTKFIFFKFYFFKTFELFVIAWLSCKWLISVELWFVLTLLKTYYY